MRTQWIYKLFTMFLLCASVGAQSTTPATRHRQTARLAVQQLRAAVDDIAHDCRKMQAQILLAELLWADDQPAARQLFAAAFEQAFTAPPKLTPTSCAAPDREILGMTVLARLARRDAAWAAQLVEALPASTHSQNQPNVKVRLCEVLAALPPAGKTGEAAFVTTNHSTQASFDATPSETAFSHESNAAGELAPLKLFAPSVETAPAHSGSQFEVVQALFQEDFPQARRLLDNISDPPTRRSLELMLRYREIGVLIAADQYEEALQRVQELAAPLARTTAFVQLAQAVRSKKGALAALALVSLARQSLSAEKDSVEKSQAFIALAAAMAELDVEGSFELAQTAITTLNALDQAAVSSALPHSEESGLEPLLERLFAADFARAWGLVMTINDRELAWFTKLSLCRAILTEPEERKG